MSRDKKVIQSYVYHYDKAFFVSTIWRDYSTAAGTVRGKETIAWEIDPETKERGKMIFQGSMIIDHFNVCRELMNSGTISGGSNE